MSGGSLSYFYCKLEEHIGDFGDKELDALVADLAELFHDREWFLSGDTGHGDWNEARDRFKEKWFTAHGREERIEQYLAEFEEEIRQTFGISKRYCKNCKHFTEDKKSEYGKCEYDKHCLVHNSEQCKKFEARDDE